MSQPRPILLRPLHQTRASKFGDGLAAPLPNVRSVLVLSAVSQVVVMFIMMRANDTHSVNEFSTNVTKEKGYTLGQIQSLEASLD